MLRVFIPGARRECQRINYTRRRTGNRLLDTGSTPVYSIKTEPVELCIGSYRIQKSVLYGVLKKIKVTALYVAKVKYNVVIFMVSKNNIEY